MLATKPEVGQTNQLIAPTWLKQSSESSRAVSAPAASGVTSVASVFSVVSFSAGVASDAESLVLVAEGVSGVISVALGVSGIAETVGVGLKRPEMTKTSPNAIASIFLPKFSLSLIVICSINL